jgi:hypothetical protein
MHNSCRLCENSESRGSHAIFVRYMPSRGKDITPRSLYSALILLVAVTVLSFHTVCLNFATHTGKPAQGTSALSLIQLGLVSELREVGLLDSLAGFATPGTA